MRVVWVSRHELTDKNWEILRKAFGQGVEVYQYEETVKDIKELKRFADNIEADAYVVVLPPNLIMDLMKIDNRPVYRFVVDRLLKEGGDVEFIPVGLERIKEIKIVTERVV